MLGMGKDSLEFFKKIEKNADATIKLYDLCNDKKDYKKIYNFVKDQSRDMKALGKEGYKVYQVKQMQLNDRVTITSTIKNFNPESINDIINDRPIEILIVFEDQTNSSIGIHTSGSGFFGGCNEADIEEFVQIVKDGMSDFTKEEV